MRFVPLAFAIVLATLASPGLAQAQGSAKADEQIILRQIQTDRRAVYAMNLDARLELLNQYAAKYDALNDADAKQMLGRRMQLDKEAFTLRQKYAKKVQQVLPSVKALRYVQLQDRIDNILAGNMYSLIPLAR
jgi:hypothetical protein